MPKEKPAKKLVTKRRTIATTLITPLPGKTINDFAGKKLVLLGYDSSSIEFQDLATGISYLETSQGLFEVLTLTREVEVKKTRIGF